MPPGTWTFWLALAGRGWGKTRVGAESTRLVAEEGVTSQLRLVGPTAADVRDTMILGPAGIMATADPYFRPDYQPSNARLVWPNGVVAHLRSADEPERLRGGEYGFEWWDEFAAFKKPQLAMDTALPGLRMRSRFWDGRRWQRWEPRMVLTTTPKPLKVLKELLVDETCYITKGSTYENLSNLAETFRDRVVKRFEGTTIGRQELFAEILDDIEGAIWTHTLIDRYRIQPGAAPRIGDFKEVVVAIDPATSDKKESDETGIVVCAAGPCPERFRWRQTKAGLIVPREDWQKELHGYVLEDASGKYSPEGWAKKACDLYREYQANYIVGEKNNGGDMVRTVVRQQDPKAPIKLVWASRGKWTRAEPVAMKYEQGLAHHVGGHGVLEDQMCTWTPEVKDWSPDRMDALVWGLSAVFHIGSTPVLPAVPGGGSRPSVWVPS